VPSRRASAPAPDRPQAYVGISGYDYKPWRGVWYPDALPARRWLEYASRRFDSIELNGTFYSLKSPAVFARWAAETPDDGFVFAVKGSRFVTHNLKLANAEGALANFYASGVLALGRKTGPFLWQLPATYGFDAGRVERFLALLPRDAEAAAALARRHDARLTRGALVERPAGDDPPVRYRHAFEVRHPSYFCDAFLDLLRAHGCAFVAADTAGRFPYADARTADFVYVRLHGSTELYASGYTEAELDAWAGRVRAWMSEDGGRDAYVYFDNDAKVHAPFDAERLARRLQPD
jgi:uncharacterized protein YecE (DUF72 family)